MSPVGDNLSPFKIHDFLLSARSQPEPADNQRGGGGGGGVKLSITYTKFGLSCEIYLTICDKNHDTPASVPYEPCHVKTCLRGFRSGLTQTRLYSHRRLDILDLGRRGIVLSM